MKVADFVNDIKNISKTRKFWVALGGAVVAFLTGIYGPDNETVRLAIGVLTALGVYSVRNEN